MKREARLARLTVVTQGCGPITSAALENAASQRTVTLKEIVLPKPLGPCAARHAGARDGDEEFLGFLDDDLRFVSGSLSVLVDRCERHGLGGASGVVDVSETSFPLLLAKTVLHRSILRDPRPWAGRVRGCVPTTMLSGGMSVFRRDLYMRYAPPWEEFAREAVGGDVELSYAISQHAALVLDPSVRVDNLTRQQSVGPSDALARGFWRLARYRSFADRHATTPRHWLAYGAVLVGVMAREMRAGAAFRAEIRREAGRAVRQAAGSRLKKPAEDQ